MDELLRALAYPKFKLEDSEIETLLNSYLLQAHVVDSGTAAPHPVPRCRDAQDQMFLDLAYAGGAEVLVAGDRDLLAHRGQVRFAIEKPSEFGKRFAPETKVSTEEP